MSHVAEVPKYTFRRPRPTPSSLHLGTLLVMKQLNSYQASGQVSSLKSGLSATTTTTTTTTMTMTMTTTTTTTTSCTVAHNLVPPVSCICLKLQHESARSAPPNLTNCAHSAPPNLTNCARVARRRARVISPYEMPPSSSQTPKFSRCAGQGARYARPAARGALRARAC